MAEINPLRRPKIEDMKIRNLSPVTQRGWQGTLLHRTTFWGLNVSAIVVPLKIRKPTCHESPALARSPARPPKKGPRP
ncbi:MAG: hypothetical protein WA417_09800 [Stellaceae bacterium]